MNKRKIKDIVYKSLTTNELDLFAGDMTREAYLKKMYEIARKNKKAFLASVEQFKIPKVSFKKLTEVVFVNAIKNFYRTTKVTRL